MKNTENKINGLNATKAQASGLLRGSLNPHSRGKWSHGDPWTKHFKHNII